MVSAKRNRYRRRGTLSEVSVRSVLKSVVAVTGTSHWECPSTHQQKQSAQETMSNVNCEQKHEPRQGPSAWLWMSGERLGFVPTAGDHGRRTIAGRPSTARWRVATLGVTVAGRRARCLGLHRKSDATLQQKAADLINQCRATLHHRSRTRCMACTSSCSWVLIGTKRMFCLVTASAIASASRKSFLFDLR